MEQRLAGILVLSGYLPGASQFTITKGLESTPVLHCHGSSDPVVIPDWAVKTRDHVTEKGYSISRKKKNPCQSVKPFCQNLIDLCHKVNIGEREVSLLYPQLFIFPLLFFLFQVVLDTN